MTKQLAVPEVQTLTPFEESHPGLASWLNKSVIATDEDYHAAAADLVAVTAIIAKAETERKKLTKPLNDVKRGIDDRYRKPFTKPAEAVESHLRKLVAKLREARLNALALTAAQEVDQTLPLEVQADVIGEAYREQVLPDTACGVSVRSMWKARVVDPNALPREYLVPDTAALNKMAQAVAGPSSIPGVVFEDVGQTIVSKR